MLHTDFPCNYTIAFNPELPGTGLWHVDEVFIPENFIPKPNAGHLILKVQKGLEKWILHLGVSETSEVWTTADPDRILVCGEKTYLLSLGGDWAIEQLPLNYIVEVTPVEDRQLLLVNDYFGVIALGREGIVWQALGLAQDDFSIRSIDGDTIMCSGYDYRSENDSLRFTIDLRTGKAIGGSNKQKIAAEGYLKMIARWLRKT